MLPQLPIPALSPAWHAAAAAPGRTSPPFAAVRARCLGGDFFFGAAAFAALALCADRILYTYFSVRSMPSSFPFATTSAAGKSGGRARTKLVFDLPVSEGF